MKYACHRSELGLLIAKPVILIYFRKHLAPSGFRWPFNLESIISYHFSSKISFSKSEM